MKAPLMSSAADVEEQKSFESSNQLNAKKRRNVCSKRVYFYVNNKNSSCFSVDISKRESWRFAPSPEEKHRILPSPPFFTAMGTVLGMILDDYEFACIDDIAYSVSHLAFKECFFTPSENCVCMLVCSGKHAENVHCFDDVLSVLFLLQTKISFPQLLETIKPSLFVFLLL